MAPPIKLSATDSELLNLRAQGWRLRDIGDAYGVSTPTVDKRLREMGAARRVNRQEFTDHLAILPEHMNISPMHYLRWLSRLDAGDETLSEENSRSAIEWARQLRERDLVVTYSQVSGFEYAERAAGDPAEAVVVIPLTDTDLKPEYRRTTKTLLK